VNALLLDLLACPRCRGPLRLDGDRLRCACGGDFAVVGGIPRLGDGAGDRDPTVAAELRAQEHAHPLYVDRRSVVNHWEELALPRLAAELDDADGPVLDLGCGVGHFGRTWAAAGRRAPMIGLDLVAELLDDVTAGYAGLIEGDVHRLPVRDAAFGAVVIADALHHMADPVAALREVRRALRPGGIVLAHEPRELAPLELVKKLVRRGNDAFGEHHRAFRTDAYRRLFAGAGLEVTRLAAVDAVGPLVAATLDLLRAGRLGVARLAARALVRIDAALERGDRTHRLGLMLFARARKPAGSH
jgi:SAM-dependent methyltransferase